MVVQYYSINSATGLGELVQRWSSAGPSLILLIPHGVLPLPLCQEVDDGETRMRHGFTILNVHFLVQRSTCTRWYDTGQ